MGQELADIPEAKLALGLLDEAYDRRLKRAGRSADHPVAVAELLLADGQAPPVIVTGLLHDVLEDTDVTGGELRERFGPEVSRSVQALTQDGSILKYRRRKAALRRQVLAAGPGVAAVSLADKLAKLRRRPSRPPARKLAHYQATLDGIEARYGRSRLSQLLREQLARWPDA